jgi:hypothetical protein
MMASISSPAEKYQQLQQRVDTKKEQIWQIGSLERAPARRYVYAARVVICERDASSIEFWKEVEFKTG